MGNQVIIIKYILRLRNQTERYVCVRWDAKKKLDRNYSLSALGRRYQSRSHYLDGVRIIYVSECCSFARITIL